MQNKGFIGTIAVLLILICAFYISFSFITKRYEKEADEYAIAMSKTSDTTNKLYKDSRKAFVDSLDQENVYLGYTYAQVKKMEIGLGLDLKGGMNLVLEVPVTDMLRRFAKPEQLEKVNAAIKAVLPDGEFKSSVKPSEAKFMTEFANQFPEGKMAELFQRNGEFLEKINKKSTNAQVVDLLNQQIDRQVDDAFNVFRNRIDKFGVSSPNIQKIDGKRGQILLELPGVKEPEQMTHFLQSSANLEFYEVYNLDEINTDIQALDSQYAAANGGKKTLSNYFVAQGGGPVVGYVQRSDTAAVNAIINSDLAREILPADLKLRWSNKATDREFQGKNQKGSKNSIFELVALKGEPRLEGDAVTSANSEHDNMRGNVVNMRMSDKGAQEWAIVTKDNIGRSIAIVLDDNVYSYPTVNAQITGGNSEITGNFTPEEANDLANLLKSGKMDAKVRVVSSQVIGPSLGAQAIQKGFVSFIVALVLLMVFMVAFYGIIPGLVANVGIMLNLYFTFGILASLQAVLTLSGIAGIVLAMGMAVDANVLIFERTKEELRAGKKLRSAIADGYSNAFSAIFDGNLTSIITGVILLVFGSGPIKGFATTLIIGLVCSFFTAIFLTRIGFEWLTAKGRNQNMTFTTPISRKFTSKKEFNFIGASKKAFIVWGILIVCGVASLFVRGLNQGIDFSGGRNYVVAFQKSVDTETIKQNLGKVLQDAATKAGISEPVALSVINVDNDQKVRISTNYKIADDGEDVEEEIAGLLYKGLQKELTGKDGKVLPEDDFRVSNETTGIVSIEKVGPSVANDMREGAVYAVLLAVVCMFLYILIRFRNVAFSVGAVSAVALTAFMIIAFYSVCWGFFPFSMEVDQSFIAAVLTIIGYQINDTVVVFDRVRETLRNFPKEDKKTVFNNALNATLTRTVMTSVSTLLVLLCIFILGGDVIRSFTFAMIFGVAIGTFCSLFFATPIAYKILTRKKGDKKSKKLATAVAGERLRR